ncbi:MAG: hypothetical protein IPG50_19735 [Myxococcales bacterium]|nr:hypothetical protein [Myxococcales bacterium]
MIRMARVLLMSGSVALAAGLAVGCSQANLDDETEDELALQAGRTKDNVLTDNELLGTGNAVNPTAEEIQKLLEKTPHGGSRSVLADKKIAMEDGSGELPVSQVIYNAAKLGGVNPLALLVRLQLEQSLVGTKAGQLTPEKLDQKLAIAFGCGCPHAPICKTEPQSYTGFYNQVSCAVRVLKQHMDSVKTRGKTSSGWGTAGVTKTTQDGVEVTPENAATAVLYTYTPYAGQDYGGAKSPDCKTSTGQAGYCAGNALHTFLWDSYASAIRGGVATPARLEAGVQAPVTDASASPAPVIEQPDVYEPPTPPPPPGECSDDSACTSKTAGKACLYDYTCGCYADSDCTSAKPVCDTSTNRCKAQPANPNPNPTPTPNPNPGLPRPNGDAGLGRLSDAGAAAPELLTPAPTAPRPADAPENRPAAGAPGAGMGYNAGNEYGENTSYTDGGPSKKKKAAAKDTGGCSVGSAGREELPSSVFLVAGVAAIFAGRRRRRD